MSDDILKVMKDYVDPLMVETLTTNASGSWWPYEDKQEEIKLTLRQKLTTKISGKIDSIRYEIARKICPWAVSDEDY